MPKNLIDDVYEASPNRRSFIKKIATATAAVGALTAIDTPRAHAAGPTATDIEVLNFALNLEYLEAQFYTYAHYGMSITEYAGIAVNGVANPGNPASGGSVTGGKKVSFSNSLVFTQAIGEEIGSDERAHVVLLRNALGSAAIAQPNINLDALGIGFNSQNEYLTLSRIFEDIGVSAYAGAAYLLSAAVVTTAARILAAESQHVSTVRTQIARLNIPTMALDGADLIPPPSGSTTQYLSIYAKNGLAATRTPQQVLYLAYGGRSNVSSGGFFPTGVNGAITMSGTAATAANLA
jgi:hypothetical protein